MPVYTYRCENCGIQIDRHLKYTDKPLTRCPECNKKSLRKVISPVRIVFKGSGFYSTDHQSPSGQKRTPSSKTEPSTESPKEVKEIKETKDSTPVKSKSDSSE
jgi:putative FmdB family regulatory protein